MAAGEAHDESRRALDDPLKHTFLVAAGLVIRRPSGIRNDCKSEGIPEW
jgi:hypothetical protein